MNIPIDWKSAGCDAVEERRVDFGLHGERPVAALIFAPNWNA